MAEVARRLAQRQADPLCPLLAPQHLRPLREGSHGVFRDLWLLEFERTSGPHPWALGAAGFDGDSPPQPQGAEAPRPRLSSTTGHITLRDGMRDVYAGYVLRKDSKLKSGLARTSTTKRTRSIGA